MRLLLDNNLSPRLAEVLSKAGWDAVHVVTLGLRAAEDIVVTQTAVEDNRVLVSADTDFGALLAATRASRPSVVLVRRVVGRRVEPWPRFCWPTCPRLRRTCAPGAWW